MELCGAWSSTKKYFSETKFSLLIKWYIKCSILVINFPFLFIAGKCNASALLKQPLGFSGSIWCGCLYTVAVIQLHLHLGFYVLNFSVHQRAPAKIRCRISPFLSFFFFKLGPVISLWRSWPIEIGSIEIGGWTQLPKRILKSFCFLEQGWSVWANRPRSLRSRPGFLCGIIGMP